MIISLKETSTKAPSHAKKDEIKKETKKNLEKIYYYQRMMFAQAKHSILLLLQGMDASGKDGTVKDIFTGINPIGCKVISFKAPTTEEKAHDFLRRIHQHAPSKWMIHIFNRSHYEDILVPWVNKELTPTDMTKRCQHINNFEKLLTDNDTHIVKCYLHISREEQKERLEERLELPHKFRKHHDQDRETRKKRDKYMGMYEKIFQTCNKVPRHVIPADQNRWKAYSISKILLEVFESMDIERPALKTSKFK